LRGDSGAAPGGSGLPGDVEGGDGGAQVVLVDPGVVGGAEPGEVGQGGRSAVCPVLDVMRLAPLRGPAAAGVGAALVPGPERGEQGGGDQSLGASHVQGLALGAQDHRDDRGVAGQSAHALGGEDLTVQGQPGAADGAGEALEVDGDHDLGFGGGGCGAAGGGSPAPDLDQGIGAAPLGRARVAPAVLGA